MQPALFDETDQQSTTPRNRISQEAASTLIRSRRDRTTGLHP